VPNGYEGRFEGNGNEGEGKVHLTNIAPQLPHMLTTRLSRHRQDRRPSLGLSPHSRTLACSHTAVQCAGLTVSIAVFHVIHATPITALRNVTAHAPKVGSYRV